MNQMTFISIKRGLGILIPFCLLILVVTGCATQQEIRAKKSLERASAAYTQANANPNVKTYAPDPLAEAGKMIQAAEKTQDYVEIEQLGYRAEKKSRIAETITEGKMVERENESLTREAADLLLQKRVLEANLAKRGAETKAREAEQSRAIALAEADKAERSKKEAELARSSALAEADKAERSKKEAEQARLESREEAEKAEKARMEAEAKAREAEQTKAEIDQFLKDLSDLQGKMTERGIVLTMGDVLFSFGKADLSAGAVRNLDKLTGFLEKHPDRNVLIEGHTDSIGSDEFNLALSQKRADAVKEVMVGKGIGPDRIVTKGYGKQFPVAGNDTESGRQLNRRVEVVILNEGVKPESVLR